MMPVRRTQNWLPSIFNDFFDNDWMVKANATAPAINVFETEKEYKVELAAPGMTKEDFNVRIDEENNLVITMEKKTENKEEKKEGRYLRREFSYSKFQQTMILPDNVDKEKISAAVENGVLNVQLPKISEEEVKKAEKQIEVKSHSNRNSPQAGEEIIKKQLFPIIKEKSCFLYSPITRLLIFPVAEHCPAIENQGKKKQDSYFRQQFQ